MDYILKREIKEYGDNSCYCTETYEIKGDATFRDILNKFDMYDCYKYISVYYGVKSDDVSDKILKHFINKVDDKFIEEHQNDKVSNVTLLVNKVNDNITSVSFGIFYIYYNQDN